MKRSIVLFLVLLCGMATRAQNRPDTARMLDLLAKVQELYKSKPLSFHVRYTVAGETDPSMVLDSMQGEVAVNGASSHYRLPGMETVTNPRYQIILFKEDKLMYLGRPVAPAAAQDPMAQVRALIAAGTIESAAIREEGRELVLEIGFGGSSACKTIRLQLEKATGLVRSIRYLLKTELLPGIFGAEADDNNAAYGNFVTVQMDFSSYKTLDDGPGRFDEKNFFTREGGNFKTTAAYQDYTIFKATPNL